MLKDRRVLLEQDLKKLHQAAGQLYLQIVRSDGDVHNALYQELKEQIADLQSDINIVNALIKDGHE